jgi:S-adenosylmethionine:tRNA ribosyltransferase-isomerase
LFKTPITDLDYELDPSSIAQNRYKNPEYSNLLIAESKQILTFSEYIDGLKDKSVFVFNKSTVQNVRINTNKVLTNGKIEFFILNIHDNYHADCLIKTRSKINVGDELNTKIGLVTVLEKHTNFYTLKFKKNVYSLMENYGQVPLPPYIEDNSSKYSDYLNEFSEGGFSVAASTAGLHFTNTMIDKLKKLGHEVFFINLDINLGTFKSIDTKIVEDYEIHSEDYSVGKEDYERILFLKSNGFKIILVGTTVLRSLETVFNTGVYSGKTNLFITPSYKINIGDYLITNFHAPRSSLLSIIQAIYGAEWKDLYIFAQKMNLKFLSFGDAVLFKINE